MSLENKSKPVGCTERYKDRVQCVFCNKSLSVKCMRYTHKCNHPDAEPRVYDKAYFKSYYLEKR